MENEIRVFRGYNVEDSSAEKSFIHVGHEIIYLSYLISRLSCTFPLQLLGAQFRKRLLVKLRLCGSLVKSLRVKWWHGVL